MQMKDGMHYVPTGKPSPVVAPGEFVFAAVGLSHGHIHGMSRALIDAGATLGWVYDPDPAKVDAFIKAFPQAKRAESEAQVFADENVRLIASACIPSERCALGLRAMDAGKDYFTDKPPLTTLSQLEQAREAVRRTGRKYMVYYSERLHSECGMFAGTLIERGEIGRVIQVIGMGPHRIGAPGSREPWFYEKAKYGGILCDIGSHQVEQFLFYTGAKSARVVYSQVANHAHPEHPELEDFGDAMLVADNGATNYFRVDWLTPDGLSTWGDGRTFILGTKGYIEMRKYLNIGTEDGGNNVIYVNDRGEHKLNVTGQVGYPFFGQLILDCIHRTENAMTQEHAFLAAELCVRAEMQAARIAPESIPTLP